jgi:hypothetical protein
MYIVQISSIPHPPIGSIQSNHRSCYLRIVGRTDSNLVVLELGILRKGIHQPLHLQHQHRRQLQQQLRNPEDPLVLVQLALAELVVLDHLGQRLHYSEEWLI